MNSKDIRQAHCFPCYQFDGIRVRRRPGFHASCPAPEMSGYTENPPGATASADITGGTAQSFVPGQDIPAEWWKLFSSDPLNALVEQALKANPDLQAAEASLRQAQENCPCRRSGALFPAVDANAGVIARKFSPAAFGETGARGVIVYALYNASVSVSLRHRYFRRRAPSRSKGLKRWPMPSVSSARRPTWRFALVGNVVTAAVQEASFKAQVKATQEIVDLEQNQLNVLQEQFRLGAIPKSAVLAQDTALAQEQTALAPLGNQLSQGAFARSLQR